MCKRSEDFIDHLLLQCKVRRDLWVSISPFFGIEWVMPKRVTELASWRG